MRRLRVVLPLLVAIALGLGGAAAQARTDAVAAKPAKPTAEKVVFFAADGMRPDLMERYAGLGLMPTYARLMADGVKGTNGLTQAFPPNTGVGWYTLATGAYPGEHGSTNNTFHRTGESNFNNRTAAFTDGILQADTIMQAAERAGKTVVSMEWSGGRNVAPKLQGPVVDYRNFYSNRGILLNYDLPGQLASAFGVAYDKVALDPAAGWTNTPASYSPAMQETLTVTTTFAAVNPTRLYDLYVYDSTDDATTNYDGVVLVPQAAGKNASQSVATLAEGDWADVKVSLSGSMAGKTAGFHVKAIDIAPDLSEFRLYWTSVARANASYLALGSTASADFEETLNRDFASSTAADYAPLEALIIDEDTYVEQGLKWKDAAFAYLEYILDDLEVDPDLLMLGNPVTDEFSHQFMGLVTAKDMDGDPNPYYDDLTNDDVPDGRLATREGYLRAAYAEADETLGLALELMGEGTTAVATSDHGFGAQWWAVNASKVLKDAGLIPAEQTSNCRAAATDVVKVCVAGGTAQVYVNPTLPAGMTYEGVRTTVVNAFQSLADPNYPGKQVVLKVMKKEELRNVQGSDSLHPNRSGDVVVVLRPPYQFDAFTPGKTIAFSQFFGQHGYLPELVDLEANVNMHGTFVAAGPGIRKRGPVSGVRAVDLAPTVSFLMGIPGPVNARGRILYELMPSPERWKEVALLYISDFHGQLTPLSQTADTLGPSFGIGGAAWLKPWFDLYRAEAQGTTLTVTGGDAVGASPAISNFFDDKPTMHVLNMLGVSADTFGNHNFDRGSQFLREELIPIAQFPYLSSNTVFASSGKFPSEWKPSATFNVGGFKLGVVGYTLPELATLIFPGYLDPFKVTDPVAAVNAEAAKLHGKNVDAVVAVGHLGGDGTDVYNPTGALMSFANALTGVDVALGGHTHTQYVTTAANGVLVAESPNSGLRFTRIRLTVDPSTKQVVYKTADFHKPWNIGVTPDAAIEAYIADLNAQLAPIFNTVIGESTVAVPRSDSCGRADGRLCESLIGDIAADALRETYATDFAITNAGGLRAALTCPFPDIANDFCAAFTPPPYPITRGSVLGVLPFGNVVFTVSINGAELKAFLENGVSSMPAANGRFPQVSGLCFTYDVAQPTGSRVLGVVRQAADGTCTGAAVDLTAASTYTIAENDFMATGGDGYPNVYARGTTQDLMDEVLADWIVDNTPVAPALEGRIVCTDSVAPNSCPVLVP